MPSATFNRRRSIIGGFVAVAFLVVVFARVIPQVGDYQGAFDALGQLSALDVATLVGALLALSLVAAFVPARRATAIQPVVALKSE